MVDPELITRPEDLEPGDLAVLRQNWTDANDLLDHILRLNAAHRETGCELWCCGDERMAEVLLGLDLVDVQILLRAAIERLTSGGVTRPPVPGVGEDRAAQQ